MLLSQKDVGTWGQLTEVTKREDATAAHVVEEEQTISDSTIRNEDSKRPTGEGWRNSWVHPAKIGHLAIQMSQVHQG